MSKRMSEGKSRIEPVKTQVPTSISEVPKAGVPGAPPQRNWDLDREELNRQIQAQQKLKKGAGMFDGIKRKAGQKAGEWLFMILMVVVRKLRDVFLDSFLSLGIYKKDADGKPIQKVDENGDLVYRDGRPVYVIAWGATLIAVLVKYRYEFAFLTSILGYKIFGVPVFDWIVRIVEVIG